MEPIRTLIIDDEKFVCEGCRLALKQNGHSVDVRMTGKEGVEALRAGDYEVILLDLRLPDMDGMEILRILTDQRPGECLIVITGYPSVKNAVEAMKLGAYDYLAKPFSDDELLLAVERAAEKRRLMQENRRLRNELLDRCRFSDIIGEDPKIVAIFEAIKKVAPTDTTVLLYGESGHEGDGGLSGL